MPDEQIQFLKRSQLLTFEEIERFVRIVVSVGVNKVRLTGGEPLVRADLDTLIKMILGVPGLENLGLTTNGILLCDQAEQLYRAGLRKLNISLDTLNESMFEEITRRKGFRKVIEGIHTARELGFHPIKINAVAINGITDSQLIPLAEFARELDVEVRFIEYMPLDSENDWERQKVLLGSSILQRISEQIMPLKPVSDQEKTAPASSYLFEDGRGKIGIIPSVSQPFCSNCDRFRLTADGHLRNCLFSLEETSIKELLRGSASDEEILEVVRHSLSKKKAGHEINSEDFIQPDRPMHSIGG